MDIFSGKKLYSTSSKKDQLTIRDLLNKNNLFYNLKVSNVLDSIDFCTKNNYFLSGHLPTRIRYTFFINEDDYDVGQKLIEDLQQ